MSQSRTERATSFGAWADEYDDCRPSYPDDAVEWLVDGAQNVVEVGAGTGKLTDRLVALDRLSLDVTEIDGRMLRLIRERHPGLRVHEASATGLPVPDHRSDAVLVADAWQWFPEEEAASEVTRALRPAGWLGCIWNDLAATTPDWQWDAVRLSAGIADQVRGTPPMQRLGLTHGHADQQTFTWAWALTPSRYRRYVSTLSHVQTLSPRECQEALDKAERLAEAARDASGTVMLEFDAVCVRWQPAA